MPPQGRSERSYGINWWYGFNAGVDVFQGVGPLGTRYLWTPTPAIFTVRYLSGRGALS